jgi:hypothetical protein
MSEQDAVERVKQFAHSHGGDGHPVPKPWCKLLAADLRTLLDRLAKAEGERDEALEEPLIERLAYEALIWTKDPAHNPGADQPSLVFARRFAFLLQRAIRHD